MSQIAEVPDAADGAPLTIAEYQAIQGAINDGIVNQVCACKVHRTGDKTGVANNTATPIDFDVIDADGDNMFDLADPTKVTIRTAGWYDVSGGLTFESNTGGSTREVQIRLNGATVIQRSTRDPNASGSTHVSVATTDYFNVGDYVELVAFQNSGGARICESHPEYANYFRVVRA